MRLPVNAGGAYFFLISWPDDISFLVPYMAPPWHCPGNFMG
jgi:hypothetical protein